MCPGVWQQRRRRIEARQNKGPTMPSPLDGHYSNMRAELTSVEKKKNDEQEKWQERWGTEGWREQRAHWLSEPPNVTRTLQVAVGVQVRGCGRKALLSG